MSAPLLERLVERIAHRLYGTTASWEPIPSDETYVFRLELDGLAPRIVKIDRSDGWIVRREQLAFPALRTRGFPEFPEVEFTQGDLPDATADFFVMPETPARRLSDLWAENRDLACWTVNRTGDFLRRLAGVPWNEIPGVASPSEQSRGFTTWFYNWLHPLVVDPTTRDAAARAMSRIMQALQREPTGFGGWQFAQVLTDGRTTFTAVDWTNIGAYWPLSDLASTIAALNDYGADAATTLEPVLLDAYTGGNGLSDPDAHELRVWQAKWCLFSASGALRESDHGAAKEHVELAARLVD
jgi:Ser/Thr protein kinase RdoA (MazF antagonist)